MQVPLSSHKIFYEEQIITGYSIDGTMDTSGGGWVRKLSWFVYITTLLLRGACWLVYCIVGHLNPASAPPILLVLLEPH